MLHVSPFEYLTLALLILAGGIVTGIFSGLFGIGGGAIIVPVLYEVFRALEVPEDLRMQLCIGTSLAIIVPTTLRSYLAHRKHNAVLNSVVRRWTIPIIAGVALGSWIAGFAPGWVFKTIFVVFAILIASRLLLGRETWRLGDDFPGGFLMSIYGAAIGLCSSLMGISGGAISNAVITLYGKTIQQAVATSSALGVPLTIVGTIGYIFAGRPYQASMPPLSLGFVSLIGFVLIAPVSSLIAPYGARLAHRLPKRKLEIAFAIFLLTAATRFLISLLA